MHWAVLFLYKLLNLHDGEEDKDVPGTYNPAEYANLQVSQDVKDLFEYIQRYKPQKLDLDTKLKPFIPDYVPAVGEVDACLKMPKPDGTKDSQAEVDKIAAGAAPQPLATQAWHWDCFTVIYTVYDYYPTTFYWTFPI